MKHNVTAGERWDTASIARSARVFLPCVLQRSLTGLGATAIRRVNGAYSTHKKCTGPSTEAWGTPEVTPEVRNFTPLLSTNCVLLERLCAAALDRVYRQPALIAELSKVLAVSEADAVVAVRQGYRSIEGMHEFMRLAGVVMAHVTCQPRDDGHAQLDALDEQCWAHVRWYLQLDDVAWPCRSSTNVL
ncbi:uncharacterized protein LOC119166698 isoform X1 [Rhipicephalus microplus]|uniref:uncharacterized protein LOC119166698 isoform X1 n=1 Tax=Rhipicephalus microplus TaxID=6941 RepID=UPI003F6AF834